MTATDELRRMLDERGVFWVDIPRKDMTRTVWKESDGQLGYCYFNENKFGVTTLLVSSPTPEQAIAATLGRGTCKVDKLCDGYLYYTGYWCRGCDERFAYRPIGGKDRGASPKFCPNCGARIVDPTTNDVDAEVGA